MASQSQMDQISILKDMSRQLQAVAQEIGRTAVHASMGAGGNPFNGKKIAEPFEQIWMEMHQFLASIFSHHGGFAGVNTGKAERKEEMIQAEARRESMREERQAARDQMVEERISKRDALREEMTLRKQFLYEQLRMEKRGREDESKSRKKRKKPDEALATEEGALDSSAAKKVSQEADTTIESVIGNLALTPEVIQKNKEEAAKAAATSEPSQAPFLLDTLNDEDYKEFTDWHLKQHPDWEEDDYESLGRDPDLQKGLQTDFATWRSKVKGASDEDVDQDLQERLDPKNYDKEGNFNLSSVAESTPGLQTTKEEIASAREELIDIGTLDKNGNKLPTGTKQSDYEDFLNEHYDKEDEKDNTSKPLKASVDWNKLLNRNVPAVPYLEPVEKLETKKQGKFNYKYEAMTTTGEEGHYEIDADNEEEAQEKAKAKGHFLFDAPKKISENKSASSKKDKSELPLLHDRGMAGYGDNYKKDTQDLVKELQKSEQEAHTTNTVTRENNNYLEGFGTKVEKFGEISSIVFKQGGAFLGTAAAASSPDAYATLSGSFKLLAAQVGRSLMPAMVKVSYAVQNTAHWFGQLSESTRSTVGNVAMLGVGIAGVMTVIPGMIRAFSTLGIGTGVGLAGAAAVGYGAYKAIKIGEASDVMEAAGHEKPLTKGEINTILESDESAELANMSPEQRKEHIKKRRKDLTAAMNEQQEIIDDNTPDSLIGGMFTDTEALKEAAIKKSKIQKQLSELVPLEYKHVHGITDVQKVMGSPSYNSKEKEALFTAHNLMLDLQSHSQPAYMGIDELYKKIQLEALAETPLQQEIRKIQIEQRDALLKIAGFMEEGSKKPESGGLW
jgi:hypothetical protein